MLETDYIEDLFAPLGPVGVRNMFGGQGVYYDGLMIALVAYGTVYLKTDTETVPEFEAAGSEPFTYVAKDRSPVVMSYWRLPEEAIDDPDAFRTWAEKAVAAAIRANAKKKPKKKKTASEIR
ncbi:TfoX/Sxy family protein [Amorphus orientalis]|uniref:DNA transformation protein n=1 Tax=Amorphus orientalis TaxID=649198 RepID=A0AAE3VSN9_9HYPH|nr:TfoX/Sxy family protein [Amorphus orientalis]MDQ0317689.1 DNA transformation protein [Amorphus orientalis]